MGQRTLRSPNSSSSSFSSGTTSFHCDSSAPSFGRRWAGSSKAGFGLFFRYSSRVWNCCRFPRPGRTRNAAMRKRSLLRARGHRHTWARIWATYVVLRVGLALGAHLGRRGRGLGLGGLVRRRRCRLGLGALSLLAGDDGLVAGGRQHREIDVVSASADACRWRANQTYLAEPQFPRPMVSRFSPSLWKGWMDAPAPQCPCVSRSRSRGRGRGRAGPLQPAQRPRPRNAPARGALAVVDTLATAVVVEVPGAATAAATATAAAALALKAVALRKLVAGRGRAVGVGGRSGARRTLARRA